MSGLLQNQSFLTWTKDPAALDIMKRVLCGFIRFVLINFLNTFDDDEVVHLPQFINDLNNDLVVADRKTKVWILHCNHKLCRTLLQKLTAIRQNPKSLNIVWKTSCKTVPIRVAQQVDYRHAICITFYWHVANTFMFYGNERNEMPNTCPDDTDVALVLKMMKNCTLFEIDEAELYEQVISIRNRIFHAGQYNMDEQEMEHYIDKIIELLEQIKGLPNCTTEYKRKISSGIRELKDIKEKDIVSICLEPDWKTMAVKALQLQKQAIECDILFRGTLAFDTYALKRTLAITDKRIQKYTNSEEWLLRKINELEERIESIKDKTLAGRLSEGRENALSDFGAVGRATGAVAGAAAEAVLKVGKRFVEGEAKLLDWMFGK